MVCLTLVEGPIWSEKAEGPQRVVSRLLAKSYIRLSCSTEFGR